MEVCPVSSYLIQPDVRSLHVNKVVFLLLLFCFLYFFLWTKFWLKDRCQYSRNVQSGSLDHLALTLFMPSWICLFSLTIKLLCIFLILWLSHSDKIEFMMGGPGQLSFCYPTDRYSFYTRLQYHTRAILQKVLTCMAFYQNLLHKSRYLYAILFLELVILLVTLEFGCSYDSGDKWWLYLHCCLNNRILYDLGPFIAGSLENHLVNEEVCCLQRVCPVVFVCLFVSEKSQKVMGFPGGSDSKESSCRAGEPGSIPGLGRSPGEWNGYLLQYSCPDNSMDRGAWWAIQSMGLQRFRHDWVTNTST